MNFVELIRDRKKIAQIKNLLRGKKRFHDLLLFVVGINTALRISDLLQLQIIQFLDEQGRIKHRFWIKERKRGKRHEVVINNSIREALTKEVGGYALNGYGAFDMAGNVWEWVADCYDTGYYNSSPDSNPTGPSSREKVERLTIVLKFWFLRFCYSEAGL